MKNNLFHFLVTGDTEAWELGFEDYLFGRYLEYTTDEIASRYEAIINPKIIEELKSIPCLVTYEGGYDLKVAKITHIEIIGIYIRVHIEIDQSIAPIPYAGFHFYRKIFGVHDFEFTRTHWAIKSGDLFSLLKTNGLLPQTANIILPDSEIFFDRQDKATIGSVRDFIDKVIEMKKPDRECFYRGHSDETYLLKPSVFRADRDTGAPLYRDSEHEMFREILISNSYDFREDSSTLDKLVRMQHYSLPTRLLDITGNPLIALFFAVWSEINTKADIDGEVILFSPESKAIKYFDSDTASCIANLALMSAEEREQIKFPSKDPAEEYYKTDEDREVELIQFNEQIQVKRLIHYIGSEKPYFKPRIKPNDLRSVICVKSKRSNDRISSQSGAFFLFGQEATLNELGSDDITVKRIRVTNKRAILEELELLNITESSVFPYIEYSARDIARRYKAKSETL